MAEALTVLVVEDEAVLRVLVERMLEASGHRSIVCSTGERAVELIEDPETRFDILLTDVMLGGVDGYAVADALCRYRQGTPVVVMSGQPQHEVLEHIPAGCRPRFVAKPYGRETLVNALLEAWRQRGGG
jgi:two-component system sensor histidine kinase TorS